MSIDYQANYGIGYRVKESEEIENSDKMEYGLEEYIESEVGVGFDCFSTNRGYDTDTDAVYLVVENPFSDGLDLTKAKERLDAELARLKVEADSEFNEVGGMYVY